MFELILSKVTIEMCFASIPVLITWAIYRKQLIDERKRIINSIDALLQMTGKWFDAEYPDCCENPRWYDPKYSVFPVDTSQIPNILTSNLLSEKISTNLSFFIQLVRRFNHRIEVFNNFLYSNTNLFDEAGVFYEKVKELPLHEICIRVQSQNEALGSYLKHLYSLQKKVHTSIGQGKIDDDIPSLCLCFRKLQILLEKEKTQSNYWLKGFWVLLDFLLLVVPFLIILTFIVGLVHHHIFIR